MINGLAIWHFPHRTNVENIEYFYSCGFKSVSMLGDRMYKEIINNNFALELANAIKQNGIVLTVHSKLPRTHSIDDIELFKNQITAFKNWQNEHGLISILSFDVPQNIRDNITPYIDYVLDSVQGAKIAVEDFGLTDSEKAQIEHLKQNPRFGYLVDIGHTFIRICGKNDSGYTLFTNSKTECPANKTPTISDFLTALNSKEFPIFEIHLHNNDGVNDMHYFLEDGALDIKMIATALKQIKIDGVLTLESAPGFRFTCEGIDADNKTIQTFNFWKNLIK